jgi:hypothetical protein
VDPFCSFFVNTRALSDWFPSARVSSSDSLSRTSRSLVKEGRCLPQVEQACVIAEQGRWVVVNAVQRRQVQQWRGEEMASLKIQTTRQKEVSQTRSKSSSSCVPPSLHMQPLGTTQHPHAPLLLHSPTHTHVRSRAHAPPLVRSKQACCTPAWPRPATDAHGHALNSCDGVVKGTAYRDQSAKCAQPRVRWHSSCVCNCLRANYPMMAHAATHTHTQVSAVLVVTITFEKIKDFFTEAVA